LSIFDEDKIYVNIASGVIGGSMSSRLFQEIREKKGLAYSVYTYNQNFSEGGVLSTYIGTNKESYEEAIEITLKEFKKLREEGITENELQKAKNKQLSRMAFSMENPNSRMYIFGHHFIKKGKLFDVKEFENDVKRVEVEKINKFLKNMFTVENITILGNV
jgi:zinc protease